MDTVDMKDHEIEISVSADVVASTLEHFHYQAGGDRLNPVIAKQPTQSDLIIYHIIDGSSKASVLLKPLSTDKCRMTINLNDSKLWGWMLGVPGRSELGVTTFLGSTTSSRCEDFCNKFIGYLEENGYLCSTSIKIGGRKPYPEDEWARDQVHNKHRDKRNVFKEWQSMENVNVRNLTDLWESFRKMIKKPPKS